MQILTMATTGQPHTGTRTLTARCSHHAPRLRKLSRFLFAPFFLAEKILLIFPGNPRRRVTRGYPLRTGLLRRLIMHRRDRGREEGEKRSPVDSSIIKLADYAIHQRNGIRSAPILSGATSWGPDRAPKKPVDVAVCRENTQCLTIIK